MKIEITPVVIVPDAAPLIHLAAAGLLHLFQDFGRVVIMDIVAYEATANITKPWAEDIAAWMRAGANPGANQPVTIAQTEIGEAYRLARMTDPGFKMKDAGERAIRDWLIETLPNLAGPALVIYEDQKMPKLMRRERFDDIVVLATTRAMLAFAEGKGLISSAEDAWKTIIDKAMGASPVSDVTMLTPMREP